jgi:hypothetical protein
MTSNEATENEMIVYLQTHGAVYDRKLQRWSVPRIRGIFTTFSLYRQLKMMEAKP